MKGQSLAEGTMRTFQLLISLFLLAFAGHVFAIDELPYSPVKKTETYEIRLYPPMLVAQTNIHAKFTDAGALGFRILADYLFGNNQLPSQNKSARIEMMVPMMMQKAGGGFIVSFGLPRGYELNTAPLPLDSRIQLQPYSSRQMAVITYSGRWTEDLFQENLQRLMAALQQDGISTIGKPIFCRYNSALLPGFWRRNEIWLEIPIPPNLKKGR